MPTGTEGFKGGAVFGYSLGLIHRFAFPLEAEPPEILQCGSAKFRFAAGGIKVFITIEQGAVVLERAFLGDPKSARMAEV